MSKVLLVSDLHLRHDRPTCRLDEDWMASQAEDLHNITSIIKENGCEGVWLLGDIFHRPVEPPQVVNTAIDAVAEWGKYASVYAICGNHDLPYHSINNWKNSSISTLFISGCVKDFSHVMNPDCGDVEAFDFGMEESVPKFKSKIVICHRLVFPNDELRGLADGDIPQDIFNRFPDANIVLMGDYHDGWECKIHGQLQIMVGCLNIQSAKLKDYKPRVIVFDTETYEYETVYLPQDKVSVTNEHLVESAERDERLEKCVESFKGSTEVFDFIGNLESLNNKKVNAIMTELLQHLSEKV